jgi:hypothetical protein
MQRLIYCLIYVILTLSCNSGKGHVIVHNDMKDYAQLRWEEDSTVLVFSGNATFPTRPFKLPKGKYTIEFKANGNAAQNVLPHFVIGLGDFVLTDMEVAEGLTSYTFNFELQDTVEFPLQFTFDNDYHDSASDRNVFLHFPVVVKPW